MWLQTVLKDSDSSVRSSAANALGAMGESAKATISQLIVLLKDSSAFLLVRIRLKTLSEWLAKNINIGREITFSTDSAPSIKTILPF
jgi:HEAT repeat protein